MAITKEDFEKYIGIMESSSENEYVKKIVDHYYNSILSRISDDEIRKLEDPNITPSELAKIKNPMIQEQSIGNMYEFIKSKNTHAPGNKHYFLDQYCFKPIIKYDKHAYPDSLFFNSQYGAQKHYLKLMESIDFTNYRFKDSVIEGMANLLKPKNGNLRTLPSTFLFFNDVKMHIYGNTLDKILLALLNDSLSCISESTINSFFNKFARLNVHVIEYNLKHYDDYLKKSVKSEFNDIIELVRNFKFFSKEDNGLLPQLSSATGELWESITDVFKYYGHINLDDLYPGMYVYETFVILEEILLSEFYNFETLENIQMFTIFLLLKVFFEKTMYEDENDVINSSNIKNNNTYKKYKNIMTDIPEYKKLYSDIRKLIIESGRYNYTLLDTDNE